MTDPTDAATGAPRRPDLTAGTPVLDLHGERFGSIARAYPRHEEPPEFVKVEHDRQHLGPKVVSLEGAVHREGTLQVAFTAEQMADAPHVDAGHDLDAADAAALTAYYQDLERVEGSPVADTVPLPPRGQEKEIPSEGPEDRSPRS